MKRAGTIGDARKRVLTAQAKRAELRLARERGALFDARIATQAWSAMVAAFRAHLLGLPRALAPEVTRAAVKGPAAIEALLMREMRAALEHLSNWEPPRSQPERRPRKEPT